MNKEVLRDFVAHNLDDIAKIAIMLSTKLDKTADAVGYLQFLMLQYNDTFARAKKYLGDPNLPLEEIFAKRGVKSPNPQHDVNLVVQSYAKGQIYSPTYMYEGQSIINPKILNELYMPTSIDKPELQVPLANLARISIADGGLSQIEQKRIALQTGLDKLSERGQELFELIVKTATHLSFTDRYRREYIAHIDGLTQDVNADHDGKLVVTYATPIEWETDPGTHIREAYGGFVMKKAPF